MVYSDKIRNDPYSYQEGFGSYLVSEAVPSVLPDYGNNPKKCAYGLYAEQLSGTAFTADRANNQHTWLYKIRPSVGHLPLKPVTHHCLVGQFSPDSPHIVPTPTQLRWDPLTELQDDYSDDDFVSSLRTVCGAGDAQTRNGLAIHLFVATKSMEKTAFYNSDGNFLVLPVIGDMDIKTELGIMRIFPGDIAVIPRGFKFTVMLCQGTEKIAGYVLEVFNGHFVLPELGPIGANCLANARDFKYPVSAFEDIDEEWTILNKFLGGLYTATQNHSPYDVVGYHGNYSPYKYDLSKFCAVGSVSFDHPDPSIFTVLTCRSDSLRTPIADFIIFPPRWLVAEHTFRPPYFHRNCMTEFMVNVRGVYDAKAGGFLPGGASLHSMNAAHGPDVDTFEQASNAELGPQKVGVGSLSVMFESSYQLATTEWAIQISKKVQKDYHKVWDGFKPYFRNYHNKWIGQIADD
ncbi:Homogentisate 1,2-dioxygenase [Lipomyces tetrasporus]